MSSRRGTEIDVPVRSSAGVTGLEGNAHVDRSEQRPVVIVVRVVDLGGVPRPGVCVQLTMEGERAIGGGVTATDGTCRIAGHELGMYFVETTVGNVTVDALQAREYEVEVRATRDITIRGRIVAAGGVSPAGARVLLGSNDSCIGMQEVASVGEDGAFVVVVGKVGCVLSARMCDFQDGPIEAAVDGVELRLGFPATRCRIRTLDAEGVPVGCHVLVGRPYPIRMPLTTGDKKSEVWAPGREYETGPDGCVEVDGLMGYNRDLQVVPKDGRLARWCGVWQGLPTQTVELEKACVVEGRVFDASGAARAGLVVYAGSMRDWRRSRAYTNVDGAFVLHGIGKGLQTVVVAQGDSRADVRVDCEVGGRRQVTLVLGERAHVELVDASGQARAGAMVRLRSGGEVLVTMTDDRGLVAVPSAWWSDLNLDVMSRSGGWNQTSVVSSNARVLTVRQD